MRTAKHTIASLLLVTLAFPACKEEQPVPPSVAPTAHSGGPAVVEKPATPDKAPPVAPKPPLGLLNPFPHLSNEASAPFNRGWAALKLKKFDEAATAFSEVATQLPDYLNARYQAARALVLAGKMAEARAGFEELLRRNFVAYSDRVSKQKELAPFRASPEWAAYQQTEAAVRADYAAGLGQGLILVARAGAVDPPTFTASKTAGLQEAKLDWKQEVYHYDAASDRFRPLTHSDGHVLAALRSSDGKRLVVVTAERLGRLEKDAADASKGKGWFAEPQFFFVDLAKLDVAGPIKLGGGYDELTIGFGASGTALISTPGVVAGSGEGTAAGTYEMDTARTGLTKAASDPDFSGERVVIFPNRLQRSERPAPSGVTLAEDRHSLRLGNGGAVITSARSLSATSLAWSPGLTLFAYAGQLDGCAALRDEKAKAAQNEIFIYEVEKKSAQRIDGGPSAFDLQWLSDGVLAYESGAGAKASVNLYDVVARKKTTLPLKNGAGFVGIPTLSCGPTAVAAPPAAALAAPAAPAPATPPTAPVAAPIPAPVAPSVPAASPAASSPPPGGP